MKVLDGSGRTKNANSSSVLRETGGPTNLTMASVADGELLFRSGTTVDGQPLATQAEMEAASSVLAPVTPGRVKFHPGVAKAWVNFNGTGTVAINASHNVTSITDNGTGDYTVNFTTAFSSANYVVVGITKRDSASADNAYLQVRNVGSNPASGAARFQCKTDANIAVDCEQVHVASFGDQ